MKYHYVPGWRDEKHQIRGFEPDPANGPIFCAVDWGGTNPHAVNWYQLLKNEIEVEEWVQPREGERVKKRLKEGTLVCFDEIYIAEIGNDRLGDMVILKESEYKAKFKNWRVYERYADPQGKAARTDWKDKGLRCSWHTTREFDEHIKIVKELVEDGLFFVAGEKCPNFVREIKKWRADPNTGNQIDVENHCMSAFRYAVANIKKVKKRALGTVANLPSARTIARRSVTIRKPSSDGPLGFSGKKDEYDNWRRSLGEPVTRVRP
jgi:hypothetical protein